MNYETSIGLNEQSKNVVAEVKIKLSTQGEEEINEEYLEELLKISLKKAISTFNDTRPFVNQQTMIKRG